MKNVLFFIISLTTAHQQIIGIQTTINTDERVSTAYKKTKLTRQQIKRQLAWHKKQTGLLSSNVRSAQHQLNSNPSSLKGWTKEQTDAVTTQMNQDKRAIKDHQDAFADLQSQLTSL